MAKRTVFQSVRIFDGDSPTLKTGLSVVVEGGNISAVSDAPVTPNEDTEIIDGGGRVLMPGLIDAHVHVYAASLSIERTVQSPVSYLAHFAAQFLRSSLDRGFTTVRDVGGADVGLAAAIRDGFLTGVPRLFYGGRFISQTGGHGDMRPGDRMLDGIHCCGCSHSDHFGVIADGADAVRRAVREELRRGASHIKIMASGGVLSPTDPLDRCQYSEGEIRAAVEEADRIGAYVVAHCHPKEAIRRSAELGIRSIEHGTLLDRETADIVAEKGAYVVPTMATIVALAEEGPKLGLPQANIDKLNSIVDASYQSLRILLEAGVKTGFGTDLVGPLHVRQSSEFSLRGKMLPAAEILRSACSVNAELMGQSGKLGCVKEGAAADLLLVDGNPLEDVNVLAAGGTHLAAIMKNGVFHKRLV